MEKNKLYVFILKDLTPSQQAVQGGHVVSVIAAKNPTINWSNQTFVYLKASRVQLNKLAVVRVKNDPNSAIFIEPDYDHQLTAYACFGGDDEFKQFRLI